MNTDKEEKGFPYFTGILLFLTFVLIVLGAQHLGDNLKSEPVNIVTILPEIAMPDSIPGSGTPEPMIIEAKIIDRECGINGKVVNARISLEFSGGVAPYQVEFDSGDGVPEVKAGTKVLFTLIGGGSLTVTAKSSTIDGKPTVSRNIHVSLTDPACNGATLTGVPTTASTSTTQAGAVPTATASSITKVSTLSVSTEISFLSTATPPTAPSAGNPPTLLPFASVTPADPKHTPKPDDPKHTPQSDDPKHTPKPDDAKHTPKPDDPKHTPKPDNPKPTHTSKP